MTQFLLRRILTGRSFYFALFVGLFLSLYHVQSEIIPLQNDLQYGVMFTPYTKWFEFGIKSGLISLFWILLPIIVSLPFADTFARDRQSGYLRSILTKGKIKEYFRGLYLVNFLFAGVVITIPLLANIYFAFMFVPNIKPDPVINNLIPLDSTSSFFPDLYYSHPFIHMLFFVALAFIFAGMFATISLSISFFAYNRFVILVSGFLVQMLLSLIAGFTGTNALKPTLFLLEYGAPNISFPVTMLIFGIGMIVSTLFYIIGVKKRVLA
ncbi:hypothetical protein J9303_04700 [Bacillaceae bacterium Marseille-Q3522]|nr:hypothetical protein [Bacillaceae bacterium Marseille-Q3522]